jgi:ABC-type uncharacterized transport system substrate-binding protein
VNGEEKNHHEEEVFEAHSWRDAPCALHIRRGTAAGKVPRIGYLDPGSPEASLRQIEALRMGLVELGYLEGKNIVVEYRYADGKRDQLSAAASELVQRQVDVIVTGSTPGVEAAKMRLRRYPLSSLPLVIFAVFALDHFMASARKYLSKE